MFDKGECTMKPLSGSQRLIFDYLKESADRGYCPTIREIGQAVGLSSTSSVQSNLLSLEKLGYIERDPMLKRSIRIVGRNSNIHQVPLLGVVTAGTPILAVEQIEEYIPYSGRVSADKPVFALHVVGESMINAGIFDNDIVIVQRQSIAKNGDIVVAMTEENEVTLKTFYKESNYVRLQPENDSMNPIILPTCTILGKAIGLYRKF